MKKISILSLISLLLFSCGGRYDFPQDTKISSKDGARADSTVSYLPQEIKFDGNDLNLEWNKNTLDELNVLYTLTNEPILYNYYLNRDIYRLVLVEKNQDPLIISINKQEDKNWVASKKIDPSIFDFNKNYSDSISPLERLSSMIKNYSKELTLDQVHTFDSIFQQTNFYELPNDKLSEQYDNYLLMESHEKNNYWYVYRSAEDESLQSMAKYMRSLTRF